jgi:nucleoid DNA-binding protein
VHTVTKDDIIQGIREKRGYRLYMITDVVDDFIREINRAMLTRNRVYIRKWGVFKLVRWKKRSSRNRYGVFKIPARTVIKFVACKTMRERCK